MEWILSGTCVMICGLCICQSLLNNRSRVADPANGYSFADASTELNRFYAGGPDWENPDCGALYCPASVDAQASEPDRGKKGRNGKQSFLDQDADTKADLSERPAAQGEEVILRDLEESRPCMTEDLLGSFSRFIRGGNVWSAVGVLMILLGFGYLIRFMAVMSVLSLERRITLAALGGMVMVGVGLYLRLRRPVYAMIMQGGGIGVLYLASFAAAGFVSILSAGTSLLLMSLLMLPAVGLALLQRAQLLAMFGFLGGYAAPLLVSTGSGDYMLLFSYYMLLDIALLVISRIVTWRWLNLLGAVCTFGVTGGWALLYYHPAGFAGVELFLLGFSAVFLLMGFMPMSIRDFSHAHPLDKLMVLGIPLAVILLQFRISEGLAHGLSFSALSFGAFFIGLAAFIWKIRGKKLQQLAETYAAGGVFLVNLSVPLSFSGAITAGIWAVAGAFLFLFGCRFRSAKIKTTGIFLQTAAGVAFALHQFLMQGNPHHIFVETTLLSFSCLATAFWQRTMAGQKESSFIETELKEQGVTLEGVFALLGMLWWMLGLSLECAWFAEEPQTMLFMAVCLSATVFFLLGHWFRFQPMFLPVWLITAFSLLLLSKQRFSESTLLSYQYFCLNLEGAAWLSFILAMAVFFHTATKLRKPFAAVLALKAVLVLTSSIRASAVTFQLSSAWLAFAGVLPSIAYVLAVVRFSKTGIIRKAFSRTLVAFVPAVLFTLQGAGIVWGLFDSGSPFPLPRYLPLFNPLELSHMACMAGFLFWQRQLRHQNLIFLIIPNTILLRGMVIFTFIWLHGVIARTAHCLTMIPYNETILHAALFQALVTMLWAGSGLAAILLGNKLKKRDLWMAGALCIALDSAKLFLHDLVDKDSIYHIISFFVVGGMFLLIGLLAPLPPANNSNERKPGEVGRNDAALGTEMR